MDEGLLNGDVAGRHRAYLSLVEHRHGFNARQRASGRDKPLGTEHGSSSAPDPTIVVLHPRYRATKLSSEPTGDLIFATPNFVVIW